MRTLAAVDVALREAEQLHHLAQGITFWTYLFHRTEPGVSEEVLGRPLPQVVVAPPPERPVARVVALPPPAPVVTTSAAAKSSPPPGSVGQWVSPPPAIVTPEVAQAAAKPIPGQSPASGVPHPELPRIRAFARFAFAVAKSDGRVAQSERKVIRSFLASKFGHHDLLVRHIDPLMEEVEAAVPTEAEAVAELRAMTTAVERQELYRFAELIADAAGERKPREQEALARIALAFGVTVTPAAPVVAVTAAPAPAAPRVAPTPDARTLLEIPPGVELTPELIRRRLALLGDRLDPARAREMGPEFARMAEEKLAKLRAAAEALIAPLNEPLERPDAPPPPADPRHNPDLDDAFGG